MLIEKVLVIGAGQMGSGIAQVCAQSGYEVTLNDINEEAVDKGVAGIERLLSRNVERERMTEDDKRAVLNRIAKSTDLKEASEGVDLVIEAAVENVAPSALYVS